MKIFTILFIIELTSCEYDKRIITTLKYSKYRIRPTIVNGYPSSGRMPYIASIKEPAIRTEQGIIWLPLCGASIISRKQVLTAAHCFEGHRFLYYRHPELLRLVAGSLQSDILHTGDTETTDLGQWRSIDQVFLHKDFSFPENDIALIIVDEPWDFNDYVDYVVLASVNANYYMFCFSAGFGLTRHMSSRPSLTPVLLEAKIEVMPMWRCSSVWEIDMSAFVCTESAVTDVGLGDSGGPLGCRNTIDPAEEPGRDVLVGVVSGKNFDKTSLFTRVSRFRYWIDHPSSMSITSSLSNNSGSKLLWIFLVTITLLVL